MHSQGSDSAKNPYSKGQDQLITTASEGAFSDLGSSRRDQPIEAESPNEFLNVDPMENFANDYDLIQDLIRQMIYDSRPITLDEKAELVSLLNDPKMRCAFTEVLQDII